MIWNKRISHWLCYGLIFPLVVGSSCRIIGGTGNQPATELTETTVDLRAENQRLREEVADLRLTLRLAAEAYEKEISRLESNTAEPQTTEAEPQALPEYQVEEVAGGVKIIGYFGNETNVTVPDRINDRPVVSVGESAFRNAPMSSVVLPESVTAIDWFAFFGCHQLESVTLSYQVNDIGYGAFDLCHPDLTFYCPVGCYAEEYARSYGYSVVFS